MVETYESEIEDWFMNHRDNVTLTHFLCENIILKNDDKSFTFFLIKFTINLN